MNAIHKNTTGSSTVTSVKSPPDDLPNGDDTTLKNWEDPIRDINGDVRGYGEFSRDSNGNDDKEYTQRMFDAPDRAGAVIMYGIETDHGVHLPKLGHFICDMLSMYPEINSDKLRDLAISIDRQWNDLLTFEHRLGDGQEGEE